MRQCALAAVATAVLALGCSADVPDATFVCDSTADCPSGQLCSGGLCQRDVDMTCEPRDCTELRAECGEIDDGCGTLIDCAGCEGAEVCGAGGIPNICDCTPTTCEGVECGLVDDGCGAMIDCGGCDAPATCGGGGEPNACGCAPVDCTGLCGMIPDGCGGIADCGGCPAGETCGAGGANVCAVGTCTPITCAGVGCGVVSDGCGDTIDCGGCMDPDTCGGGTMGSGMANVCGCTPRTCAEVGAQCGSVMEPCGTSLACPDCPDGGVCTTTNTCCTPRTCSDPGIECGPLPDGCGGPVADCGTCPGARVCMANRCRCAQDGHEPNGMSSTPTRLGTLTGLTPLTHRTSNMHPATDQDWFVADIGMSIAPALRYTAQLSRIPAASRYSLSLFADCGAASAEDSVMCLMGTVDPRPLFTGGCTTTGDSSMDAVVQLTVACRNPDLYIQVTDPSMSAACGFYRLDLTQG